MSVFDSEVEECLDAARRAVQGSDQASLNVPKRTAREIEVMELRTALRALIQAIEALHRWTTA